MRKILLIILVIAVALILYGYWGAFTSGGNKVYDEMDGFYPFFMLIAGLLMLIAILIIIIYQNRKKKRLD